jgi:hypothetical protein
MAVTLWTIMVVSEMKAIGGSRCSETGGAGPHGFGKVGQLLNTDICACQFVWPSRSSASNQEKEDICT